MSTIEPRGFSLSRRRFLISTGSLGSAMVLGATAPAALVRAQSPSPGASSSAEPTPSPTPAPTPTPAPEPPLQEFQSRPDLRPPVLEVRDGYTPTGEHVFL